MKQGSSSPMRNSLQVGRWWPVHSIAIVDIKFCDGEQQLNALQVASDLSTCSCGHSYSN